MTLKILLLKLKVSLLNNKIQHLRVTRASKSDTAKNWALLRSVVVKKEEDQVAQIRDKRLELEAVQISNKEYPRAKTRKKQIPTSPLAWEENNLFKLRR